MENRKIKILFVTQEDPFYIRLFFEEFFANRPPAFEVSGVVICPTLARKSTLGLARKMFSFYGPFDFSRMVLRYLSAKLTKASIESVCAQAGTAVYRRERINTPEFITRWGKCGIDVIVSIAAPQIFGKELLEVPRWGCLNIHHAPLPFYRGMMPNFWQVFHGEKEVGITVHRMNERIDEGRILLQRLIPVEAGEPLDGLIKRTKRSGAHCMIEALQMIREDRVVYKENPAEGSYFSFPTAADVAAFRKKGYRLI
ncbi:MAG: formyl transferase [Candidatus Omnitrophica bacterium]|nr:formyl transferase [Candidatus Omnitrophota bacterium]